MTESVFNRGLLSDEVAPEVGVPSPHRYREAFERVLAASLALEEDALLPINVDVPTVVATTAGKLPGILALHERAKALPEFDATVFEQLETHVLATGHAHARLMIASAPRHEVVALNERGLKLRRMLYADAVALATHGLIGEERLAELQNSTGYKNVAFDLMALAGVLRNSWDKISGKTPITAQDLDEADVLADRLVSAAGARDEKNVTVQTASMQRQRNFTLLATVYDEIRRAITFLRWKEDDVDRIAPSLYAGRGNSNIRKKELPTAVEAPPMNPAAASADAVAPVPLTGNSAPAAGLPGASPFVA